MRCEWLLRERRRAFPSLDLCRSDVKLPRHLVELGARFRIFRDARETTATLGMLP